MDWMSLAQEKGSANVRALEEWVEQTDGRGGKGAPGREMHRQRGVEEPSAFWKRPWGSEELSMLGEGGCYRPFGWKGRQAPSGG